MVYFTGIQSVAAQQEALDTVCDEATPPTTAPTTAPTTGGNGNSNGGVSIFKELGMYSLLLISVIAAVAL